MNARQWRKAGYKTIFRHGMIYLLRAGSEAVTFMGNRNGGWMEFENLDAVPWATCRIDELPAPIAESILATAELCYCDKGVGTCDFCSQTRDPVVAIKSAMPLAF